MFGFLFFFFLLFILLVCWAISVWLTSLNLGDFLLLKKNLIKHFLSFVYEFSVNWMVDFFLSFLPSFLFFLPSKDISLASIFEYFYQILNFHINFNLQILFLSILFEDIYSVLKSCFPVPKFSFLCSCMFCFVQFLSCWKLLEYLVILSYALA